MQKETKPKRSLFFWLKGKKRQTLTEKVIELTPVLMELLPKLREAMVRNRIREADDEERAIMGTSGQQIGMLFDFAQSYDGRIMIAGGYSDVIPNPGNRYMLTEGGQPIAVDRGELPWNQNPQEMGPNPDPTTITKVPGESRIKAKPKDVEEELEKIPTPWNTKDADLDAKIALLKDKSRISNHRYAKEQIDGICKRLENRKRYHEEHGFYELFPNTTDEKISQLLSKYALVLNTSELFVATFPAEAIEVMKQYKEVTERICGERPVFYVIAEEEDFKQKVRQRDPILLAQSPFGFYWQVLGAWDKEMILLSEL